MTTAILALCIIAGHQIARAVFNINILAEV